MYLYCLYLWGISFTLIGDELLNKQKLSSFIEKAMVVYDVPGCAVGIVKNGKIIFIKGYGYSNIETKQKVNAKTRFKIQSVSKTFTAVAVMQLVESGLIKLNDPISKYIPYFVLDDMRYRDITIKMCMNHTSGIPTMYKSEFGKKKPDFPEML